MNRKKAEEYLLRELKNFKDDRLIKLYHSRFKEMSNQEFDDWIRKLETRKAMINIIVEPGNKKIGLNELIDYSKKLGISIMAKIRIDNKLLNHKSYMNHLQFTGWLPIKRTQQTATKGLIVAKGNSLDMMSGQVTGTSRPGRMTKPEIEVIAGLGLPHSLTEITNINGGDLGLKSGLEATISQTGRASQEEIKSYSTGVESRKTLQVLFKGMHLDLKV